MRGRDLADVVEAMDGLQSEVGRCPHGQLPRTTEVERAGHAKTPLNATCIDSCIGR